MMHYCKRAVKIPWGSKSIFQIDNYIKCACERLERKPQEADMVDYSSVLGISNHRDLSKKG